MTVRMEGETVVLEGDCHVEDAEALLQLVAAGSALGVDMSTCRRLHGAVLQVLLAFDVPLGAAPEEPFLRDHVAANLRRAAGPGKSV